MIQSCFVLFLCNCHINSQDKKLTSVNSSILVRLTLLLGPPGSGKTTLLLALAGKLDKDLKVKNMETILKLFIDIKDRETYVCPRYFFDSLMVIRSLEVLHTMDTQ